MGQLIIDFYKLVKRDEKYSFPKIINIARGLKSRIEYDKLDDATTKLIDHYDQADYELVRSKYIAHQDINVPEVKTDLGSMSDFTNEAIGLFQLLLSELNVKPTEFESEILDSFKDIFDTIDEYEKVKAFLMVSEMQGNMQIDIKELAKFAKGE